MVILDIATWWAEKATLEQIFWFCALPASFILVILLITTFLGGDIDSGPGDVDLDIELDDGAGFQFFTFKNLVGFFTIFGWVGVGCVRNGVDTNLTFVISTVCGLLMMVIMASIFYFMSRMEEDGTMKFSNAIGRMGEVYMRIPANGQGFGKVQINVQGTVRELDAINADAEDLPTGSLIKVIEIIDGHILKVTKHKN